MSAIEEFGRGLLNVLWGLSVLPAGLASFVLIIMLGLRLSARMPGPEVPEGDLHVARVILTWPDPTARAPWKIWLLWVTLLCLITVPGATYLEFSNGYDSRPGDLILILSPFVIGGLAFYIIATWVEWLARVAAMRRQPALVLLAPAALIGGYAIVCRLIGPAPVDTALLHSVGIVLAIVIIALFCAAILGAMWVGWGLFILGIWLLWWPFGRVVRRPVSMGQTSLSLLWRSFGRVVRWWRGMSAAKEQ